MTDYMIGSVIPCFMQMGAECLVATVQDGRQSTWLSSLLVAQALGASNPMQN